MRGATQLFKGLMARFKSILFEGDEEKLSGKQMDMLEARIDSAERILLKERDCLLEELQSEADPLRRRRIILGITEIENVLKKRRMLEDS